MLLFAGALATYAALPLARAATHDLERVRDALRAVGGGRRGRMPDLELPDHTRRSRTLSEVMGGDPSVLCFSRGWWCPKEQCFLWGSWPCRTSRGGLHAERGGERGPAGGAVGLSGRARRALRVPSDHGRAWIERLGLREVTATVHDPYRPTVLTLFPDLTIHAAWTGYWYWAGRPSRSCARTCGPISRRVRPDWTGTETA